MNVSPPQSVARRGNLQRLSFAACHARHCLLDMTTAATTLLALAAISRLLQAVFIGRSSDISERRIQEKQLQVLSEVVSGPARGKILALHLDAALPADIRQAVLGVEAVRREPHFILNLDLDHSHGKRSQKPVKAAALSHGFSCSSYILHVVVWITIQPEPLQWLWLHWKPRNLLLFSMGSSIDNSVLKYEALSSVEKLTLIRHLSAEADRGSDTLGVFTVLPFSSTGVQFLGPWERESFSSWEALFPDRFPSFQGYTFHIASRLDTESFFFLSKKNHWKKIRLGLNIVECLSAKLNFTYTTTKNSPDSKWGAFSNGVWNGVMGMIHRREKNFTINDLVIDINRGRDFDFSTTIYMDGFGVYLRSPDPLPNWMSIAKVFQGSVWLAVLFAFVASTCFTLLQVRRTSSITDAEKCKRNLYDAKFSRNLFFNTGAST
ncbi:putative glutamate receptor [Portunus trituberculatus]|uniref:Putative glutamate receptor n=1 Tax=Portunus trituberculatus TaxID=210409 RepID=A0A5B7GV30_PORTR|nr:putative glutamate receptor [Portunus trituberculatus]